MKRLALIAVILLAGCAASPPLRNDAAPPAPGNCPVTASGNWQAWVNAMPGPGSTPKLIVTGDVTVPTGGYSFGWVDMRVAESYPVQVFVRLTATPPSGRATQALTTTQVRGEWAVAPPVGAVTIQCGTSTLARISPVETAH